MKKIFLSVAVCAMMAIATTSCSKSTPDLLNEYRELGKEVVEATKNGDLVKIQSLAEKGEKIEKELKGRELTDEEKAELAKIETEISSQMSGAASDMLGL